MAAGDGPAAHQAETGAAPDLAQAGGSAIEYNFAENGKQNLRRAPAGRPSDIDHQQAENQRDRTHVAQALGVLLPRANHFGFGESAACRAKSAAGQIQARDTERRDQEEESALPAKAHW